MTLLRIQENKISEIVNKINQTFFTNIKPLYFQAPTGSGKTKILARVIEEMKASNPQDKLLFLVASISTGGIEWQNYSSLKQSQKEGCNYKVGHISSGLNSPLEKRYNQYDVLTIGESSYKNGSNLFEYGLLEEFINRKVNNEEVKIIFIRDEAHIGTKDNDDKQGSQNLLRLKKYFYKCLYLSATIEDEDVILDNNNSVVMSMEEAQDANLIKKMIVLNDGGLKKQSDESENLLLKSACKKLKYLKENVYPEFSAKLGKQINPALLIQISSKNEKGSKETKRTDEDEQKEINEIVAMCKKFSLTIAHATNEKDFFVDDGGLYLNKKIRREDLQKHDSEIDVIVFKTKLAIGWDIPRACILCQLRNVKSEKLHIQTCGRIMRNIFIAQDNLFNELDDGAQKNALSCWVYSYHESAKQFESFSLELKNKWHNEKIFITSVKKKHDKKDGIGYMGVYKTQIINDIYNLFNEFYKDKTLLQLLNGNGELIIRINKTIKIGETSNDISELNDERVIITRKITNQFQLDKEFFSWINRRSPALKPLLQKVLTKLDFEEQKLFKSLVITNDNTIGNIQFKDSLGTTKSLNGVFGDKLVAIKRRYQTEWEKDQSNWRKDVNVKSIVLPKMQNGSSNSKEQLNDLSSIRHIKDLFTTKLSDDEKFYGTKPEIDFLEKLDIFVETHPNMFKYIHRNLPCNGAICYSYIDSEQNQYRSSYPDYIIQTKTDLTVICELKSSWDRDTNKTESIKNGYKRNSMTFKELNKYFLGIIQDQNRKFQLFYFSRGKKLPTDFAFLQEYEKRMIDYAELSILFECISLIEESWDKSNDNQK